MYYLLVDRYVIKVMFKYLKYSDSKMLKRNKFDLLLK